MSKKYNHAMDLAFEVETTASCEGDDYPTTDELVAAIMKRVANLIESHELEEAIGAPFDTYIKGETV